MLIGTRQAGNICIGGVCRFEPEFREISFKEWGKKMQDDITDGVNWLIEEGIADSERIGIYGGSYGGYATLAGLTFTPDLYACGVDYVGVSNIFSWMGAIPPYWEPYLEMIYEMVGDPQKDSLLIHDASPLFHADKIKAPLFIAQGANDPRVPQAESDQIVEALKKEELKCLIWLRIMKGMDSGTKRTDLIFTAKWKSFSSNIWVEEWLK